MVNRKDKIARFQRVFAGSSPRWFVRAPGRVNLIGEHVDYNDGFVLPIATSQAVHVLAAPADNGRIEVHTAAFGERVCFPADEPGPPGEPGWANYVRGVAEMLRREGLALRPGRLLVDSEVPVGGGLSSSAALEVGVASALLALAGAQMEPVRLALLARRAEHEYARSPCGIMDQFACVLGRRGHALLLDCRSQEARLVPMVFEDAVLVVLDTQVRHSIAGGEYRVRQEQCRDGLAQIQTVLEGVNSLRDVRAARLDACRDRLEPVVYRRCRHVATEIERTTEAADALRRRDAEAFGRLMTASHASLRDDYEVSCPELDALADLAGGLEGCYGARMTGGGFGGCAIALVRRSAEAPLRAAVREAYDTRFDRPALVTATTASDGASVEPL